MAEIRREYPNAYLPWTAEADAALLAAHQAGHDVAALAGHLRPPALGYPLPAEPPGREHPRSPAPQHRFQPTVMSAGQDRGQ